METGHAAIAPQVALEASRYAPLEQHEGARLGSTVYVLEVNL